jgi:hypothetical protein
VKGFRKSPLMQDLHVRIAMDRVGQEAVPIATMTHLILPIANPINRLPGKLMKELNSI